MSEDERVTTEERGALLATIEETPPPATVVHAAKEHAPASPGGLLMLAMQRQLPTEQLQMFIDGHNQARAEERLAAYRTALSAAQAEYEPVRKTKKSDRGMYAPMDEGVEAVRVANGKYGLSFKHRATSTVIPDSDPPAAIVRVTPIVLFGIEGKISHEEKGDAMETVAMEIPGNKPGFPQMSLTRAIKGAITFLRRTTFEISFGIAPQDDDDAMHLRDGGQRQRRPRQGQHQPQGQGKTAADPRPQHRDEPWNPKPKDEPAPKPEPKASRAEQCLAMFTSLQGCSVIKPDLEALAGRAMDEWKDGDIDGLIPHYADLKATPIEERAAKVKSLFNLEPGAQG